MRDATDRIISQTTAVSGTASTVRYSYTGPGDSADYTLTTANAVTERTLGLPGGVTVSIRASSQVWSYPNLHGDVAITATQAGTVGTTLCTYDPFGDPIDPVTGNIGTTAANQATPGNTSVAGTSYGWEGSHQRLDENIGTISTIEMGARQYLPLQARFLSVDPIAGGNTNDYNYPNDPINGGDLDGRAGLPKSCYNPGSRSIIRLGKSCSALARKLNANNGSTKAGIAIANFLGAQCSHTFGSLLVCTGASRNPGGGGTTLAMST